MPVNIGNPNEMTMLELARHDPAADRVELRDRVRGPLPEDDPKVRQPDITRARTILGWEPQVALEEGLRRTLDAGAA